ncbi:MAG: hypothetical protein U5K53_09520 [Halanaerobiales bacterium]|nr:hypothetical protein [Halanaerobiales bacterium]
MESAVTDVFLDNAEREFIEEHMKIIEEFIIDEETMNFIKKYDLIHNNINGSTIKYLLKNLMVLKIR